MATSFRIGSGPAGPRSSFFDIGANQGLYAILAARNPVCTGIYAFEPVPTTAALLRRNASLNPSGVGVRVIPSAISAIDGPLTIAVHHGHTAEPA